MSQYIIDFINSLPDWVVGAIIPVLFLIACSGNKSDETESAEEKVLKKYHRRTDDPPFDHEFRTKKLRDAYHRRNIDRYPWFRIDTPNTLEAQQQRPRR